MTTGQYGAARESVSGDRSRERSIDRNTSSSVVSVIEGTTKTIKVRRLLGRSTDAVPGPQRPANFMSSSLSPSFATGQPNSTLRKRKNRRRPREVSTTTTGKNKQHPMTSDNHPTRPGQVSLWRSWPWPLISDRVLPSALQPSRNDLASSSAATSPPPPRRLDSNQREEVSLPTRQRFPPPLPSFSFPVRHDDYYNDNKEGGPEEEEAGSVGEDLTMATHIDQALQSLYQLRESWSFPLSTVGVPSSSSQPSLSWTHHAHYSPQPVSSYVPRITYDWCVDGPRVEKEQQHDEMSTVEEDLESSMMFPPYVRAVWEELVVQPTVPRPADIEDRLRALAMRQRQEYLHQQQQREQGDNTTLAPPCLASPFIPWEKSHGAGLEAEMSQDDNDDDDHHEKNCVNGQPGIINTDEEEEDEDDFGEFQSADSLCAPSDPEPHPPTHTIDHEVDMADQEEHHVKEPRTRLDLSTPFCHRTTRTDDDNDDHGEEEKKYDAPHEGVDRGSSPASDTTPMLLRGVETWLMTRPSGPPHPLVSPHGGGGAGHVSWSPSPHSSTSTMDTPELLRQVDQVLAAAAPTGKEPSRKESRPLSVDRKREESAPPASMHRGPSPGNLFKSPLSSRRGPYASLETTSLTTPLSVLLPVRDLTSPEARFTRRRQVEWQRRQHQQHPNEDDPDDGDDATTRAEKVMAKWPSYYLTRPNLDDTGRVLEQLPWHYVWQHWLADSGPTEHTESTMIDGDHRVETDNKLAAWEESITSQLCNLDASLQCIHVALMSHVQPERLAPVQELIHDWDQSLRLASMYWERSYLALCRAQGSVLNEREGNIDCPALGKDVAMDGLLGPLVLLQSWSQRDCFHSLRSTLSALAQVQEQEIELNRRINMFDTKRDDAWCEYQEIVDLVQQISTAIQPPSQLAQLSCLSELGRRLEHVGDRLYERLRHLSESMVKRCCRGHDLDWREYDRLVRVAILSREHFANFRSSECKLTDFAECWSEVIMQSLCHEADRSFAMALLDPVDAQDSLFETDLTQLTHEVDFDWGDSAKLMTLTHNLVTIRFNFESKLNYLPKVYRRLCWMLSDILHSHFLFAERHGAPFTMETPIALQTFFVEETQTRELDKIQAYLITGRETIWNHCEGVLIGCLNEYLNFAGKKDLFTMTGIGIDDSMWKEDVESLHDVLLMVDMFMSLKAAFFEHTGERACGRKIYEKFADVCRRHLRAVHVEAMNRMGKRLSSECWILRSWRSMKGEVAAVVHSNAYSMLLGALRSASSLGMESMEERKLETPLKSFSKLSRQNNPFSQTPRPTTEPREVETNGVQLIGQAEEISGDVYRYLNDLVRGDAKSPRMAPDCIVEEMVFWFARLLTMMEKIPPIVEDISAVFANLCDLYITTALRICAGSAKYERILFDIEAASASTVPLDCKTSSPSMNSKSNGSQIFSAFGRGPKQQQLRPRIVLPPSLDAEVCAPLIKDRYGIEQLESFISRAQESLQDIVKLDRVDSWLSDQASESTEERACEIVRLLEKRLGAAWSCFALAGLAHGCYLEARRRLYQVFGGDYDDRLMPLKGYVNAMLDVTPTLVRVASRIASTRALGSYDIVREIVKMGTIWEECKLHEYPNDYIDDLCDKCSLIWGFLATSSKLPAPVLNASWEGIMSAGYLSLLEGFSRVPFCTTEGRALMTLDLASFRAGIRPNAVAERLERRSMHVSSPPIVELDRGMTYVDTYIKVFYYPQKDIMEWISENHKQYRLCHMLALVSAPSDVSRPASPNSEEKESNLFASIKSLYIT